MDYKKLTKIADGKIRFVNHGEWADPEYTDGKKVANYYDVEEYLYSIWKDAGNKGSVEEFNEWLKAHPEELEAAFGEVAHDDDSYNPFEDTEEAVADSKKAVKRSVKKSKIKDSKYMAYSIILNGNEADEMGNGDADEGAKQFVMGYDFSQNDIEEENIAYGEYKDTVEGIDIYYDYGADYYFFCPSKKAVKDDADITKAVEFCIDEDNVYDLIHEGETSVAIPSGADTKAFVAAVEDILKEVASDCGVKGLKVETEIVGNRVNVIKK